MKRMGMLVLALCLLLSAMPAHAQEGGALLAVATYAVYGQNFEAVFAYEGDPARMLNVQSLDAETTHWLELPEELGDAEQYRGKGIRYTVAEVLEEDAYGITQHVRPGTFEVIGEMAEGTLVTLTDEKVVIKVTYGTAVPEGETPTLEFAITENTEPPYHATEGSGGAVVYDGGNNALLIFGING